MPLSIKDRVAAVSNSTMMYWYPRIRDQITPRSVFVAVPWANGDWMEEGVPRAFVEEVQHAARAFEYPVFLRTDHASGKHNWKNSCFVPDAKDLGKHIYEVLEANESAFPLGMPYHWLVVREYIPMETIFTAFHGDMPINHEHRYFLRDHKLQCQHPYWPKGAFARDEERGLGNLPNGWRRKLDMISKCLHSGNEAVIERIGRWFDGWWSVDFSHGADGAWYLIDMARGEVSFHMPSCPYAPEEMREQYGRLEE